MSFQRETYFCVTTDTGETVSVGFLDFWKAEIKLTSAGGAETVVYFSGDALDALLSTIEAVFEFTKLEKDSFC